VVDEGAGAGADSDDASILDLVGVDNLGARIYRYVLSNGSASSVSVAKRFTIPVDEADARLGDLRAHGLIAQRFGGGADFSAVDPRVSIRVLTDRHSDRLARMLQTVPALAAEFDGARSASTDTAESRILTDPDAVAGSYVRLQHQATREFLAFDRPPYVSDGANPLESVILDRGVRWRAVYAAASFEGEGSWEEAQRLTERGEQARVSPELPIKLAIADRSIALVSLSLDENRTQALITESPSMVQALCDLFELYWATSLEIPSTREDAAALSAALPGAESVRELVPSRPPTHEEKVLLTLIASGLKDDVIARQLGISSRTLRRRSQDLLAELRAANRFQAAVEATKRGWV
jgi:DNA-binding CsgD family transcriptional regulator/DNA-binding Lrp family transcriptional regulator